MQAGLARTKTGQHLSESVRLFLTTVGSFYLLRAEYCATPPPYGKRGCTCARLAFIPRPPCLVYHKMDEDQNERPAVRIGILPF